jgi:uncharacterized membrane protein
MKEIEKHRKAMIDLYLGACIAAGAFTLLPSRYLGSIVWSLSVFKWFETNGLVS